jgi:hypothetical protein
MQMLIRRLPLVLFVPKIFLDRVAITMEDIVIGATAVIGIVDGIAANVVMATITPTDGAPVVQVLEITIGAKVVQTKLTAIVVTALVIHVETHAANALTTITMGAIIPATAVALPVSGPAVPVHQPL